ncbi:MAG: pyrophosphate--fructose-6-phosphate 1-phosphotransferase [Verrucomicrobia bacterium]|nr:pyrophosphate--fructose-6-phosphate 1-phosphotransferase [Verrucomicrobiota bacterium]
MKIAFLTAGGLAPCLSSSIGALIEHYRTLAPDAEFIGYLNGYQGLLLGKSITFPESVKSNYEIFFEYGGSCIGNSRVKLTNIEDCVKRGLVKEGETPLNVAAEQLRNDKIDILHTIGGDDTNTTAADLAAYLHQHDYDFTVVGMPKTVDNDVYPISQSLGAWTAAEQGALFFQNIANENTTSARQLIIHEVMGRNCGWLTAATAAAYRKDLSKWNFFPEVLLSQERWDIDAVWLPELPLDLESESARLRQRMDKNDCVNIFISEGAGVDAIVKKLEADGSEVPRDAFGHVRLDEVNVGKWFGEQLKESLGAEKVLVQKSGYFARSAAPNKEDIELIKRSACVAAKGALEGTSGVAGLDEDQDNEMRVIEFPRIKGGKPFNTEEPWFIEMLKEIGQAPATPAARESFE